MCSLCWEVELHVVEPPEKGAARWYHCGNEVEVSRYLLQFSYVTESTIITTIHSLDIGYCLFGIPLVKRISFYVSCTFLIVIVS